MQRFLSGRIRSIGFALKGAWLLVTTEHAIMAQLVLCSLFVVLGFRLDISAQDWINQTLVMALVLGMESLNTAIEKLADFVHEDHHEKIGFIKDVAAGAVTFAV
ncbi:MAG: diacylglycerol kinase family protein, partial [Candidatus Cloacimonetes bacterium]|nr:diacylglycerol kinase family protein [Candidatus Cloacimonadota bacterium]